MPSKKTVKKAAKKKTVSKKRVVKSAKKETVKKVEPKKTPKKIEEKTSKEKYFYAIGRRKTSVAKVKIFDSFGEEKITVNGKNWEDIFTILRHKNTIREPFIRLGKEKQFRVEAKIIGGGINSRAEALRLGIARAMVLVDEGFKKPLKDLGLLTRDSRKVERKKAGLKKARRAPQWSKR